MEWSHSILCTLSNVKIPYFFYEELDIWIQGRTNKFILLILVNRIMKKMSFDFLLGPHAEDEERQCESHNSTTRISSLVCEYCKKVFQGKENLKRHTKNIHELFWVLK